MKIRGRHWDRWSYAAAAALIAALLVAGRSAQGALTIDRLPAPNPLPLRAQDFPRVEAVMDTSVMLAAISRDPFSVNGRTRLQADDPDAGVPHHSAAHGQPILLGVARSAGRELALVGYQGSEPRIVRVGETIGDWTLRRVSADAAVFRSLQGEEVNVAIANP